ncbi:hypothetical protein ACTXT7_005243 [Hymenolepis weldensis]
MTAFTVYGKQPKCTQKFMEMFGRNVELLAQSLSDLPKTSSLVVRERDGSISPSRYSSSTTSLYRASHYALPFQHYAMSSAYHHFTPLSGSSATSASTGYLLSTSSPLRQRRRPWERGAGAGGGLYDRYDDSTIYRHYDGGSSEFEVIRIHNTMGISWYRKNMYVIKMTKEETLRKNCEGIKIIFAT